MLSINSSRRRKSKRSPKFGCKKLFRCFENSVIKNLEYCFVVGNTSYRNCRSLREKSKNFEAQQKKIFLDISSSSLENRLYLFDFIFFTSNTVLFNKVDSSEKINHCGFLLKQSSKGIHKQSIFHLFSNLVPNLFFSIKLREI